MPAKKKITYNNKRLLIIYGVGLWIYGLVMYSLLIDEITLWHVALSFIPVITLYLLVVRLEKPEKRKELIGHDAYNYAPQVAKWDFIHSFISVFGAVILAIATITAIDLKNQEGEFGAWFITCKRDSSQITTLPVNKTIDHEHATITVHRVTYNVPQNPKRPQPYSYVCEKAALVEVTIERKGASNDKRISLTDFSLENRDQATYGWSPYPDSTEKYDHYAKDTGIQFIDRDLSGDTTKARGWLVFSLREDNSNEDTIFTYGEYGDKSKPTIVLPR